MKIFSNWDNGKPLVDLDRLAENLAKQRDRQVELEQTIARLRVDLPGNAEAIAAAGVAFRASINRSASMIELGTAAVEALRMAGYAITPPLAERQTPRVGMPIERRVDAKPIDPIPDDWAQG